MEALRRGKWARPQVSEFLRPWRSEQRFRCQPSGGLGPGARTFATFAAREVSFVSDIDELTIGRAANRFLEKWLQQFQRVDVCLHFPGPARLPFCQCVGVRFLSCELSSKQTEATALPLILRKLVNQSGV